MGTGESGPSNSFYPGASESVLRDEQRRLAEMALGGMNGISREGFDSLGLLAGEIVLDVGSGAHPGLGNDIVTHFGARYYPVDELFPWAKGQKNGGHPAVHARAQALPYASGSVDVVHARAMTSWLNEEKRETAFDEDIRVCGEDLRLLDIEYDWSVAYGHPVFEKFASMLQAVLHPGGFDPFLGAYIREDIQQRLERRGLSERFVIMNTRRPIPAETIEEKLFIAGLHKNSIVSDLVSHGRTDEADALEAQFQLLVNSGLTTDDMRLPDVVSVMLAPVERQASLVPPPKREPEFPEVMSLAFAERRLSDRNMQIWRLRQGWHEHPLGRKALEFFARVYQDWHYIDPTGFTPEIFRELTDPEELRRRSLNFVHLTKEGVINSSVRLLLPNQQGLRSLPAAIKYLDKYREMGRAALPESMNDANTGEIGFYVSDSGDPRVMARSVGAVVDAARKAGLEYIMYGAVNGDYGATPSAVTRLSPNARFNQVFGQDYGLHTVKIDSQTATITVTGPGYRSEGIELTVGYIHVPTFFPSVANYHRDMSNPLAVHTIDLYDSLT